MKVIIIDDENRSRRVLKSILEDIKQNTFYKDSDFWLFSDSIEEFLYGELGANDDKNTFWGTNQFWNIWEDMCFVFFKTKYLDKVLFKDSFRIDHNIIIQNL